VIPRTWLVGTLSFFAAALAACSSGGVPASQKTGTAENIRNAATATAAADAAPLPTEADIEGVLRKGFEGLNIPYGATSVNTFSDVEAMVGVLKDCANDNANGVSKNDPGYWPAILGHCYTVGDGANWLYGYTGRSDFAFANQMMMRLMKAKVDEANASGASLGEGYWSLVVGKIYTLKPAGTPVAVTPPAATTP
jgi:hypothetical protein